MKIEEGDLIPGKRLGNYVIGMSRTQLLDIIGTDLVERNINTSESVIMLENARIWIDKYKRIRQIGVSKGYRGLYSGSVGIGTTLKKVKEIFDGYEFDKYTYKIKGVDGLCFELEDVENWDEETAPIEWIYIYGVDT